MNRIALRFRDDALAVIDVSPPARHELAEDAVYHISDAEWQALLVRAVKGMD